MEAAPDLDAAPAVLRSAGSRLQTATGDELLADGAAIEAIGRLVDAHRLAFAAEAENRTVSPRGAVPFAFEHGSRDSVDLVAHVARIGRTVARQRVGLGRPVRDLDRTAPSCTTPAPFLEAHHIAWFDRDGGSTDLSNGVMLCSHHHHLIHSKLGRIEIRRWQQDLWFVPKCWRGDPLPEHRRQPGPLVDPRIAEARLEHDPGPWEP